MLGIGRFNHSWQWGACGKHPVARDYFKISTNTPAFDALESWVQKGYAALTKKRDTDPAICSWRFWAKGLKKGELVSGIVKDSCDTIGRPYPLLVIGNGKLDGWEKNWESLPFLFEKYWKALEYMASRRLEGVGDFEKALKAVKAPENNLSHLLLGLKYHLEQDQGADADDHQFHSAAGVLSRELMALIPIDARDLHLSPVLAGRAGAFLKRYEAEAPNAFFIGGAGEKNYLAVFRRPLNTADFIRIWTLCIE